MPQSCSCSASVTIIFQHKRNVAEHTGSGPFACHPFDGTTEVEVDQIGLCFLTQPGGFDHCRHIAPVNLDGNRPLFVRNGQFLLCFVDATNQRVGRNKFRIDHVCPEPFAHQPESRVGDVFHRGEEDGTFA